MKFLLLAILIIFFYRLIRTSLLVDNKKEKETKDGNRIQFQDAEYEEID
tara:strand:- start:522 stop:668 length:147 start_codon:yes stop_codon:yes gene_type:complete